MKQLSQLKETQQTKQMVQQLKQFTKKLQVVKNNRKKNDQKIDNIIQLMNEIDG